MVKYALKGIDNPMGVAEYEFTKALPRQLKGEMPTIKELEKELEKEMKILQRPIDEKKSQLKQVLSRIKGNEILKERDKESLLYIFNDVVWKIKEYAEKILKDEMALFRHATIERSINGASHLGVTTTDLEVKLRNENVYNLGLYLQMDGFIKAGTKAFNVTMTLQIELYRYRYTIGESRSTEQWQEYLYHHQWSEEELKQTAEKWSEIVIEEITKKAKQVM